MLSITQVLAVVSVTHCYIFFLLVILFVDEVTSLDVIIADRIGTNHVAYSYS